VTLALKCGGREEKVFVVLLPLIKSGGDASKEQLDISVYDQVFRYEIVKRFASRSVVNSAHSALVILTIEVTAKNRTKIIRLRFLAAIIDDIFVL